MISRRFFLVGSAAALGAGALTARKGASANDRLNIACVGVGGRGASNLGKLSADNNIVALCDVDQERAALAYKRLPKVPRYEDFRVMLDRQKDIDAVVVCTPDHMHATVALAAMERGKHVYVEKPMARTISEVRALVLAADKHGVATQMGNQGHAGRGVRELCTMVWGGAIGPVREVHAWTDRPTWPQGLPRPTGDSTPPDSLNWDLWLGSAPERPYVDRHALTGRDCYCPLVWRGWWDFGGGALGDMGCHVLDAAYWALRLNAPQSIECLGAEGRTDYSPPLKSRVRYRFAEREGFPEVTVYWYDGCSFPGKIEGVLGAEGLSGMPSGSLFIGEHGCIVTDEYAQRPRLLPEERMNDYAMPELRAELSPGHHLEWVNACKGRKAAGSNFGYAAGLTEMVLLGNVAMRIGPGVELEWDSAKTEFVNCKRANEHLYADYRPGWGV